MTFRRDTMMEPIALCPSVIFNEPFTFCTHALDTFGGTFEAWRYHVAYNINEIFRKEASLFNNPRIRSRLEKLMGSNVVRITDRKYMIKLQERIKEDHLENQKKRIQEREAEEVEREKKLILEGKIPIEEAPKELQNHPVCKINQITKKILEEKKGKGKSSGKGAKPGAKRPKSSADKSEKEGPKEQQNSDNETKVEAAENDDASETSSIDQDAGEQMNKVMFKKEDYEKLKYESPLVKMLKEVENVQEMYTLAEEIVGPLKHQKTSKRRQRQEANGGPC